jgi:hydrogenase expression/formation protein HypC
MCLGIPMKVLNIKGDFAQVESGKLIRTVSVEMLAHLKEGDYIIVHAGFAIEKLDPQKAKETLRIINEIR